MMRQGTGRSYRLAANFLLIGAAVLFIPAALRAAHPQSTIGTGLNTAGDGFSETFGVGFGFGSSGNGFLSIFGTQSSSRSLGGQMGSVTVEDGGTGFISDSSLVPFVTGVVPVVGGIAPPGLQQMFGPASASNTGSVLGERLERLKSGDSGGPRPGAAGTALPAGGVNHAAQANPAPVVQAAQAQQIDPGNAFGLKRAAANSNVGEGVASVAEIRAQQASEEASAAAEIRQIFAQAQSALDAGKPNVAKIYYQQIVRRAVGATRRQALAALKSLDSATASTARLNSALGSPASAPAEQAP